VSESLNEHEMQVLHKVFRCGGIGGLKVSYHSVS
jgi:hypothetical protein